MKGECYVNVAVGDVVWINLCLLVVNTPVSSYLLGLDWRGKFELLLLGISMVQQNLNTVCSDPVKDLQNKDELFFSQVPKSI